MQYKKKEQQGDVIWVSDGRTMDNLNTTDTPWLYNLGWGCQMY